MRPYADNVWLRLLPLEKTTASGIVLVECERKQKGTRRAQVVASGRGYVTRRGAFVENTAKVGSTVYVYALAGQDWSKDFDPPRHNTKEKALFDSIAGERGEHRIAREAELLAVETDDGGIQALGEYVIVRRSEAAKVSSGGIHIPEDHAPRPMTGEVLSVGPGRVREDGKRHALDIRVGDTAMFQRFAGSEIEVKGETLLLLREDDLVCVIDSDDAKAVEAA